MQHPSLYVGFMSKLHKVAMGSLGEPADLWSIEVSCYKFRFSVDGCNVRERMMS